MSKQETELTHLVSDGGIAAKHLPIEDLVALVGPATGSEHNKITAGIIPIACWRLEDIRFEFDSSIVRPEIKTELQSLAQLVKEHPPPSKAEKLQPPQPGAPLSVFGHADPSGDDDYNKQLSGRRAKAIYALITRRTELWEELFRQPFGNDKWGRRALEMMLDFLSSRPEEEKGEKSLTTSQKSAQPDTEGGKDKAANTDKGDQALVTLHERDAGKRQGLFLAYMEKLCGPELKLEKRDFLGHGDDAGGKADFQGCSEFNPVLIFSQEDQKKFEQDKDKTARNNANAPNRRVMVLIFRKGSRVDPSKWPCPRVNEGVAGCKKRFFSDGDKRRNIRLPDQPRKFEETKDTFACRFYDRLSNKSPCERLLRVLRIRLFDRLAQPIPSAPFVTIVAGRESRLDRADSKGDIVLHDVEVPSTVTVRWSRRDDQRKPPPSSRPDIDPFEDSLRADGATEEEIQQLRDGPPVDEGFEFENDIVVDIQPEPKGDEQVGANQVPKEDQHRLRNMGYASEDEPQANLSAFQRDCETATGKTVDDVTAEVRKRHQDCDPPARSQKK